MLKAVIEFIKRVFLHTSVIYFLTSAVIIIAFFALGEADPAALGAVNLQVCAMLFAFLGAFFAELFSLIPKISDAIRTACRFVIYCVAAYISLFAASGRAKDVKSLFAVLTLLLMIYIASQIISRLGARLCNGKSTAEQEYISIYSQPENDTEKNKTDVE